MYTFSTFSKIYIVRKICVNFKSICLFILQKQCKKTSSFFTLLGVHVCAILYLKKKYITIHIRYNIKSFQKNFIFDKMFQIFFLNILVNNGCEVCLCNFLYFFIKIYKIKKKYTMIGENALYKKKYFQKKNYHINPSKQNSIIYSHNSNSFRNRKSVLLHKDIQFVKFYLTKKITESLIFFNHKVGEYQNSIEQVCKNILNINVVFDKISKKFRFTINILLISKKIKLMLFVYWICMLLAKTI